MFHEHDHDDSHGDDDHSHHHDHGEETNIDFAKLFIINHEGKFLYVWHVIYSINCLISIYMYGYLACFGLSKNENEYHAEMYTVNLICESIFTLSIVF